MSRKDIRYMFERQLIDKWCLERIDDGLVKADRQKLADLVIKHKRELRKALKGEWFEKYLYPGIDFEGWGEIVNGGGSYDSRWRKYFFPGECWTDLEKAEFIEDNWVDCMPSQYDCTGQIFTWAIDVFNVPSGVIAYIREAMDV